MKRVGVLASGRGSNLGALLDAAKPLGSYEIVVVISNVDGAPALDLAARSGVPSVAIPSRGIAREEHERRVLEALTRHGVEIICLAGYMRVLSPAFVAAAGMPILNIHPSLLPSFPGLHAQRQALEHGAQVSGATVHFVDAGLDSGPIVLQSCVDVLPDDSEDSLSARILAVEHRIYPRAVDLLARGRLEVVGRRVRETS